MTELLLQCTLAAHRSKQLAARASQIRTNCLSQHGDSPSLVSCPECYGAFLEAVRARYLDSSAAGAGAGAGAGGPLSDQPPQQQQQQQQQREWFASRRAFLSALDLTIDLAGAYQVPPQAVDDRVRDERSRWYAERVRGALLRLMVEDPAGRGAVFEKLEDLAGAADPAGSAREIAEMLSAGPLAPEQGACGAGDVAERLAAAGEHQAARVDVLREAFFAADDGTVPEDHQKYLDMLAQQRLSMEQVVDRILEEWQAAAGAREQIKKLNQRLDELRRALAAHEAQKSRKAQRREAQQKVPDELYELPACSVCSEAPSTSEFFCCTVCSILAGRGAREHPTVFCSRTCEEKGHASHAETHTCASSSACVQLDIHDSTTDHDGDMPMQESAAPGPSDVRFCRECLTSLKQPTIWCSLTCADADFQRHHEDVHLPERKKLGFSASDQAQLERPVSGDDSNKSYRPRDIISTLTTTLDEEVGVWEARNHVKLQLQGLG